MSQDNLHLIDNLFVYTKTNVDDMFARYTNTTELESGYYKKNDIDTKFGNLRYDLIGNYDFTTGVALSTWVENKIKAATTAAIKFKGLTELSSLKTRVIDYPQGELPEVGDMWLVQSGEKCNEYVCTLVDEQNNEVKWELVGNITNLELNETFATIDRSKS